MYKYPKKEKPKKLVPSPIAYHQSLHARYVNLYLRMYLCILRVYSGSVYRAASANKLLVF
jgi:hypothetical protein